MNKTEALIKTLEIYSETDKPVSQRFYQGLCIKAIEELKRLDAENKEINAIPSKKASNGMKAMGFVECQDLQEQNNG